VKYPYEEPSTPNDFGGRCGKKEPWIVDEDDGLGLQPQYIALPQFHTNPPETAASANGHSLTTHHPTNSS
jgi:hypothetical protein